jgi:CubicO group peptidase (beta-lactamase class C family)
VGYLALGEVTADVVGAPYVSWVRRHLLEPLGLDATGFCWIEVEGRPAATGYVRLARPLTPVMRGFLPPGLVTGGEKGYVSPSPFEVDGPAYGGLVGPVTDVARLAALHLNDGSLNGVRLLSPSAVAAMADIATAGKPYSLGLGWFRHQGAGDPRHIEHLGGGLGFWNVVRLYPDRGVGVGVISNSTCRWDVEAFADRIVSIPSLVAG